MTYSKNFNVLFCREGLSIERQDAVIEEEALQIIINGRDFSMTMRTPGDDRFLVRGLLFSSGLAEQGFKDFSSEKHVFGSCIRAEIHESNASSNRSLMATSSCGICGEQNLDELFKGLVPLKKKSTLNEERLQLHYQAIAKQQTLFDKTGGSHAAGAFDSQGKILCAFEDIGRHNAVDKVIGWLLENDKLETAFSLAVSSRISFEIVQKCIKAGIPALSGISAPSSMAVETARHFGLTMAAFCRGKQATFYAGTPIADAIFADKSAQ